MATSAAPLAGLLRDLGALESRHCDTSFGSIRRLLDEDPAEGWRILVDKYSKFVWSLALQLVRGTDDPEEFAAELYRRVFVRLEADDFALLRRFEGKCDFRTYLYRVVRTERYRKFRHRGVARAAHERLERDAAADTAERANRTTDALGAAWARGVGRAAAEAALAELGDEDREILTLRFASGLKLRELAEAIAARDTNDAAYRLRRALGRCRAIRKARESPDWNEAAFRQAAEAFRCSLFPSAELQNEGAEVSDPGEDPQEEAR
jgi:RNA polymerase sigma factor (sigma-70 family)